MATIESAPVTPAPDSHAGRDRVMAVGLAWTGGSKWLSQIFAWVATLFVARILTPGDYGLIALGTVYLGFVTMLTEFGLGSAVVMMRELDEHQSAQINTVAWSTALIGFLLSIALASPLAAFFRNDSLGPVLIVMSLTFVASGPRIVPQSLLQKEMRFRLLALIDATQVLLQNGLMVVFALLGFRYWAIVLGGLAGQIGATLMILAFRRTPLAWPSFASIRSALSFSRDVAATRVAWYFYSRADFIVAGRLLGSSLTGAYSMAWSLANIPVDKFSALVHKVTPAFFSLVQREPAAIRRYFVILIQGLATLSFPFAIGTTLIAPEFVSVILTDKWISAVQPLQILCLYASLASLNAVLTPLLAAVREQRFTMWSNIAAALVLPAGFVIGARWGATGIALAWLVCHPPIVYALVRRIIKTTTITWSDVFSALWPPLQASLVMAAVVMGSRLVLVDAHATLRLILMTLLGAATFAGSFMLLQRPAVERLRRGLALLRSPNPI